MSAKERREALCRGLEAGMNSGIVSTLQAAQGELNTILDTQAELPVGVSIAAWDAIKIQIRGRFHDACTELEKPILEKDPS